MPTGSSQLEQNAREEGGGVNRTSQLEPTVGEEGGGANWNQMLEMRCKWDQPTGTNCRGRRRRCQLVPDNWNEMLERREVV